MYKKIYCLFIICMLCIITSCQKDIHKIRVIVPYGSPSYATLYLSDDFEVDVINGVDPLIAAFGSKNYDVIVAPTNLGATLYQSSKSYVLAATIVWGNYFLISDSPISNYDLMHKTIYAFGENQTPDIILKHVCDSLSVDTSFNYLSSSVEITAQFLQSSNDIYLIAEPALSVLKDSFDTVYTLDLQSYYHDNVNDGMFPQASVFVKSSLNESSISTIKSSILSAIENIQDSKNMQQTAQLLDSNLNLSTMMKSIEHSHLHFVDASSAKLAIEAYFELILEQNPYLIGNQLPDEEFYW